MPATITNLSAREILDSRGMPTVEVTLETEHASYTASVPSGASVGSSEAHELRDGGERFGGKGVLKAVGNAEGEIAAALRGQTFDQKSLDARLRELDGTADKSRLGANALLGVSLAFARAAAGEAGMPLYAYFGALAGYEKFTLPQLCFNVLNGGKHADSGLAVQEFLLVPKAPSGAQQIELAAAVIAQLRTLLVEQGHSTSVGDEGGFAARLGTSEKALDMLVEAIARANAVGKVSIALDAAASDFYKDGSYMLDGGRTRTAPELAAWYEGLLEKYPLVSIEDPFNEDDWDSFAAFTARVGAHARVVGDDLLTTNPIRIEEAGQKGAVNTVLIKPNQIGTVSEALEASLLARSKGWALFASHRSGETTDTAIADFAAGLSCEYLKAGSLCRGERVCKYNRIMEIEAELAR